ncbi:MAG: PSD1 and planctomycete cytochrome C domain-containing protein [Verrucomicrobiales bacterium]
MIRPIRIVALICCLPVLATAADLDFNRDVRPILAEACFNCHGADANSRKAKLRLDIAEGATAERKGGITPIVPGKPGESELVARVNADDPDEQMPPQDHARQLDEREREILSKWIEEGAEYQGHWAFIKPERVEVKHGIDSFIAAKLRGAGLRPNPPADRATLIRRLSLDLNGLPPTPEEVSDFVNDTSTDAYEKVVDRLLASPRYGERMAMRWLDGARYADSHGYQADWERYQWPWRDWVISAYNDNMPFDQFTVEQLAGDLLPNASTNQIVATGFNRNHRVNTEGGAIAAEWLIENTIDRVETTSAVWLGLTFGCARCHDHKYDPISQREFYQFFSFFHNVPEGGTGAGKQGNFAPVIRIPAPDEDAKIAAVEKKITAAKRDLIKVEAKFTDHAAPASQWHAVEKVKLTSTGGAKMKRLAEGSFLATGKRPKKDTYKIRLPERSKDITGIMIEAIPDATLTAGGLARSVNGNFVLSGISSKRLKFSSASASYEQKGWPIKNTLDGKSNTGWAVDGHAKKEIKQAVFRLAEPAEAPLEFQLEFKALDGHIAGRVKIYTTSTASPVVPGTTPVHPDVQNARGRLAKLEAEKASIISAGATVMVMREMPKPRDAFILDRGEYDKPTEKVTAGLPAAFPPMPDGEAMNRLGLARWISSPDNPLTARVQVNRYWEMLFGTGLVASSENFGTQAEWPSHPELLDWLATEFVELGWDTKALLKTIVMSKTYQQGSETDPEKTQADPYNRLLSRGPRFRIQAELVRDQALYVSGLLQEKLGGPSVRPYQPDGIWNEFNFYGNLRNYKHDKGDDLYRRSLYTIWKRTAAPPGMTLFDMPSRETCTVKRSRTNTPLQALALLNEITYVEAARALAEDMVGNGGDTVAEQITYGFRKATCRQPSASELATLTDGYARRLARYQEDPDAATRLINQGESKPDPTIDAARLAATTTTASILLNLDETITKE